MKPKATITHPWRLAIVTTGAWLLIAAVFLSAVALADEPEVGATFDGARCWEADGTEGVSTAWGECVTPADYDQTFSVEALSSVPSLTDPGRSVSDVYQLTVASTTAASERPREFQGDTLPSFVEVVRIVHGNGAL